MITVHVFTAPDRAWAVLCDPGGVALDAFPATVRAQWLGKNVEEVSLAASSIMRYRVEEIDDNEYPTSVEIQHGVTRQQLRGICDRLLADDDDHRLSKAVFRATDEVKVEPE